jgi:hypothetical protein
MMCWSVFYYSYSNNPNFNNKSDKIKISRIRMVARHCQWHVAKTPLAVVFFFLLFSFFLKKKTERRQWEWRVSHWCQKPMQTLCFFLKKKWKTPLLVASLHKRVSRTDAFTQRHWQWRTAIRILKILISSLLLLKLRLFE